MSPKNTTRRLFNDVQDCNGCHRPTFLDFLCLSPTVKSKWTLMKMCIHIEHIIIWSAFNNHLTVPPACVLTLRPDGGQPLVRTRCWIWTWVKFPLAAFSPLCKKLPVLCCFFLFLLSYLLIDIMRANAFRQRGRLKTRNASTSRPWILKSNILCILFFKYHIKKCFCDKILILHMLLSNIHEIIISIKLMAEAALLLSINFTQTPSDTLRQAIIVHASVSECSRISTCCTLQHFHVPTLTGRQRSLNVLYIFFSKREEALMWRHCNIHQGLGSGCVPEETRPSRRNSPGTGVVGTKLQAVSSIFKTGIIRVISCRDTWDLVLNRVPESGCILPKHESPQMMHFFFLLHQNLLFRVFIREKCVLSLLQDLRM